MTGMWPLASISNATDIATNLSTSRGTTLTADASTTYVKGAWVELVSGTPHDCAWMLVTLPMPFNPGVSIAVDIGIGAAGAEIVVVPNLCVSASWPRCVVYLFPLVIPAATRVAARMSSNALSDTTPLQVHIFDDGWHSPGTGSAIDGYAFQPSLNIGTAVDPGAVTFTKGSYVTLVASTTNDLAGFWLAFDTQGLTTGTVGFNTWLADLAVGAAASEVILLPNISIAGNFITSHVWVLNPVTCYYPLPIPAGSRISLRTSFTGNTSPQRLLGVSLWGVRQ